MNQTLRYILIGLGVILIGFLLWRFSHIVSYIIISAVLSLIGRPLVDALRQLQYKNIRMPKWLCSLITLFFIYGLLVGFLSFIIPLVITEVDVLSTIDQQSVINTLKEPIGRIDGFIDRFTLDSHDKFTIENFVNERLATVFNASFVSDTVSRLASGMGNIFMAFFSISFITFFFLKDENLFTEAILSMVPDKHLESFRHAMISSRKLLIRYFIGIFVQILSIFVMVNIGLTLLGLEISQCILISLIAAVLTLIPYIGPLLGSAIGVLLGISANLHLAFDSELLSLVKGMIVVFTVAHLIDNIVSQPLIFSNSVNAHPLEIFILLLVAGSVGGVLGMMVAIPLYTIIRVFAKEFFNKFKVVKKLTQKI